MILLYLSAAPQHPPEFVSEVVRGLRIYISETPRSLLYVAHTAGIQILRSRVVHAVQAAQAALPRTSCALHESTEESQATNTYEQWYILLPIVVHVHARRTRYRAPISDNNHILRKNLKIRSSLSAVFFFKKSTAQTECADVGSSILRFFSAAFSLRIPSESRTRKYIHQ